jgi:hypothetical protein
VRDVMPYLESEPVYDLISKLTDYWLFSDWTCRDFSIEPEVIET